MGINTNLLRLIGECWSEAPENRPKINLVGKMLRGMVKNGNQNLMDYVFGMLEVSGVGRGWTSWPDKSPDWAYLLPPSADSVGSGLSVPVKSKIPIY